MFNNYCRATQFSLDAGMNSPWLHLQQAFGTLAPGAFVTIGVSADVTTLPEGTTKGGMTLTWVDGSLQIPVVVTRNGSAPIVGPVTATCGQENQANFFSARVIDDYAVDTVTLDAIRPDGTTTVVPMALSSGTTAAGTFTAQVTGGVAVYSVTATDFAGHVGTWPKSAC